MKHRLLAFALAVAATACSSKTPTNPSTPPIDPGPVVNNTPPVIGKFTVQSTRSNEPANFADASEEVPVSVEVTDAESSISNLKFNWAASVGTFSGSGPKVTWKAPAQVFAPATITINLEVVETYTSQGKIVENRPTGSTTLSLHDSVGEVSDMARQFLLDFSDSTLDVPYVMRNFQPGCYGTDSETADVTRNRTDFQITSWKVDSAVTAVRFGGSCQIPLRNPVSGDACSRVHTDWTSVARRDLDGLRKGQSADAHGVDYIAAFYYPNQGIQGRWRLCDSQYIGDPTMSVRALLLRGLVP